MKSHILFTAECQIQSIEERTKKDRKGQPTGEPYWTIKDHRDTDYLLYHAKVAKYIRTLLPPEEEKLSPPVKFEGYVSIARGNKYLCILRCLTWNSETNTYEEPNLYPVTVKDGEN